MTTSSDSEKLGAMTQVADGMEHLATFLTKCSRSLRDMARVGEVKTWDLETRARILATGQLVDQEIKTVRAALRSFSDPQGIVSQALEVLRDPADDEIPRH